MRRIVLALGSVVTVSLASLGCAPPDGPEPAERSEPTNTDEAAIFGGSVDTTHDAVVYLYSEAGFACSGTIIARNGNTGYVLSAGHCNGMDWVIQDDNINCLNNNSCDGIYPVAQQIVDPAYNPNDVGAGHDFSLIRFTGADANTPVIPAASNPDGVALNTMLDHVGYGITENGETTARRHVVTPVDAEVSALFLGSDQSNGQGTCSGDSGGPAIFNNTVVGVTSFGDQNCTQFGYDGRVQAVYNSFIAPFINGQVVENCDTCFADEVQSPGGQCAGDVNACFDNAGCSALNDCISQCPANSSTCIQNCANASTQAAIDLFNAIFDCWCVACATLCANECDPGTTTTTSVSSGNGITNGAGGGGAAGGAGAGGAPNANGGASSNGGSSNEGGGDNATDGGSEDGCGCVTVGAPTSGAPSRGAAGLLGLALAAGAVARRRRR